MTLGYFHLNIFFRKTYANFLHLQLCTVASSTLMGSWSLSQLKVGERRVTPRTNHQNMTMYYVEYRIIYFRLLMYHSLLYSHS